MYYEIEKRNHGLAHDPLKACIVPRAIGWISTISKDGRSNLAPYSQFTTLTFYPPVVALGCNQNGKGERKDTVINIEQTGEFVYNLVTYDLRDAMNITAKPVELGVDEFELAGLHKAESVMVKPFRVEESPIQFECKYIQTLRIPGNGRVGTADVIIGKVVAVHIKDEFIGPDERVDVLKMKPLGRLGYDYYCTVSDCINIERPK